ncbi:hypothetical protein BDV28DRAFT_139629 [Aspergillus coremiiformis]|uniref:Uncharacterized protein n=1 Tax=Aspergillus coremiiformis TaxID=138285 RepID=A0A5N6Z2F1_9EURO|nr:hypothetical protein BDV28DRAFT_139629 [Aspergillus coremiiformis]
MTYLLPSATESLLDSDLICPPTQQQPNQITGSSILRHVTRPWVPPGKPSSGQVFASSTSSPSEYGM